MTPSFTARADALVALVALQGAEAEPAEYAGPLATALAALTGSSDRRIQRRRQARHVRTAINAVAEAWPDAQVWIDSAVGWIARYP